MKTKRMMVVMMRVLMFVGSVLSITLRFSPTPTYNRTAKPKSLLIFGMSTLTVFALMVYVGRSIFLRRPPLFFL